MKTAPSITFFVPCVPPTATSQGKGIATRGGKVWTYQKDAQREAEQFYHTVLAPHKPSAPIAGPVALEIEIRWPYPKSHKNPSADGHWKVTKPDSVNWVKMFEDVMTDLGFWNDDAQVCLTVISRKWHNTPGIGVTVEALQ